MKRVSQVAVAVVHNVCEPSVEEAPYHGDKQPDTHGSSSSRSSENAAALQLLSCLLGSGVLSLPFAFRSSGCALCLLLLACCTAACVASDPALTDGLGCDNVTVLVARLQPPRDDASSGGNDEMAKAWGCQAAELSTPRLPPSVKTLAAAGGGYGGETPPSSKGKRRAEALNLENAQRGPAGNAVQISTMCAHDELLVRARPLRPPAAAARGGGRGVVVCGRDSA